MLKRLVCSVFILLATLSVATASHAGFNINLPGFGLHLPLPGASVNIGLPVVATPVQPVYHRAVVAEPVYYAPPVSRVRYYEGRSYGYRSAYSRPYDRDCDRYGDRRWDHDRYR